MTTFMLPADTALMYCYYPEMHSKWPEVAIRVEQRQAILNAARVNNGGAGGHRPTTGHIRGAAYPGLIGSLKHLRRTGSVPPLPDFQTQFGRSASPAINQGSARFSMR